MLGGGESRDQQVVGGEKERLRPVGAAEAEQCVGGAPSGRIGLSPRETQQELSAVLAGDVGLAGVGASWKATEIFILFLFI